MSVPLDVGLALSLFSRSLRYPSIVSRVRYLNLPHAFLRTSFSTNDGILRYTSVTSLTRMRMHC